MVLIKNQRFFDAISIKSQSFLYNELKKHRGKHPQNTILEKILSQPTSYTKSLESLAFIGISSDVGYLSNLHSTYIVENGAFLSTSLLSPSRN